MDNNKIMFRIVNTTYSTYKLECGHIYKQGPAYHALEGNQMNRYLPCLLNHENITAVEKSMVYDEDPRFAPNKTPEGEVKQEFKSGAISSGNKLPYECLTPTFLKRSAARMELGLHYGKHNWKKGAKDKDFILDRLNHAFEHLIKAMYEIDNNIQYTDDDLAAVVVNCMFAMEYQTLAVNDNPNELTAAMYRAIFKLPEPPNSGPQESK